MKKLILSLATVLVSISAFGQIKVLEDKSIEVGYMKYPGMPKNATITMYEDSSYSFMYKDIQYREITDFKSFQCTDSKTLDLFYEILMNRFEAPKNSETEIEIGNAHITIQTKKALGMPYLYLYIKAEGEPMGVFSIEPRHMNKMFGK
jgi:hypothetical protein